MDARILPSTALATRRGTSRAGTMSWPRTLAYGLLGLPLAFAALPIYVHVPRLYAEVASIGLAGLGGALLLARLLDALVDPWLGTLSDRVAARRVLIAGALPLLAIGLWLLLRPPPGAGGVWLIGALTLTTLGFSLASIAYQAWGAELAADLSGRARLAASREGFGIVGVLLAAVLPALLASGLAEGLAATAVLFVPLLAICGVVTCLGVAMPERAAGDVGATPPVAAASRSWAVRDPAFRRLLAVFAINGVAAALPGTLVLFYIADVLQAATLSGAFLALYFAAGVAALPLWLGLASRYGVVRSWCLSMAGAVLAFAATPWLGAGDHLAFAVVCLLSGLVLGADLVMPAALLADLAQRRSAVRGVALAGGYAGWWSLVGKLNLALAAGLALPMLGAVGYRPGEQGGVAALAWIYGGLPILFKLAALSLVWRWRTHLESPA